MAQFMSANLEWDKFLVELADKLLTYKENHNGLVRWVDSTYTDAKLGSPLRQIWGFDSWKIQDVDPFSVLALLCLPLEGGDRERRSVFRAYADSFEVESDVPFEFTGLPQLGSEGLKFFDIPNKQLEQPYVNALWELFEACMAYADRGSEAARDRFIKAYDDVVSYGVMKWDISLGLFLCRPFAYIVLDANTRRFLEQTIDLEQLGSKDKFGNVEALRLADMAELTGDQYILIRNRVRHEFGRAGYFTSSFIGFVWAAQTGNFPKEDEAASVIVGGQYSKEDFLSEVFMSETRYDEIKSLLLRKHNIILQGAPGVGKTFSAKRLCFSIMGRKDDSRVKFVQFHQSYTYEDFMMGYRPDATSGDFVLTTGIFYDFCEEARHDSSRQYFFLIDEINRGNISKIFGELMMAIEGDKRDEDVVLQYTKERFSVPGNLYLVGMMNTADRSLALMDYALRRRFSFCTMEPAFDSIQFKEYQKLLHNNKFDALVDVVRDMNEAIRVDLTLGAGFMVGHSYLCNCVEATDEWLGSVVFYDILPLLEEYWFEEPVKLNKWRTALYSAIE